MLMQHFYKNLMMIYAIKFIKLFILLRHLISNCLNFKIEEYFLKVSRKNFNGF